MVVGASAINYYYTISTNRIRQIMIGELSSVTIHYRHPMHQTMTP